MRAGGGPTLQSVLLPESGTEVREGQFRVKYSARTEGGSLDNGGRPSRVRLARTGGHAQKRNAQVRIIRNPPPTPPTREILAAEDLSEERIHQEQSDEEGETYLDRMIVPL